MKTRFVALTILAASLVFVGGCAEFLDAAIGSAADSAGNQVGNAAGDAAGKAVVAQYQPQMMRAYTSWLFAMAFNSGGYAVGQTDYQPGDWTRFNIEASKDGSWIERSRLADDAKGNQWWKVKFHDGENNNTIVLEALLDPTGGKMLRLRGLFPGDKAPSEMPVDQQTYYVPPQKLTPESIEGATVGTETITVPAGTFVTKHVRYGHPGGGSWDWWASSKVPGGLVKYSATGPKDSASSDSGPDSNNWTLVLQSMGHDAKDELGAIKPAA